MLTEAEAKTKWCPMTRHASAPSPTDQNWETNRLPGSGFDPYCIGSACMMWRQQSANFQPNGDPWPNGPAGFCGLAGRPA